MRDGSVANRKIGEINFTDRTPKAKPNLVFSSLGNSTCSSIGGTPRAANSPSLVIKPIPTFHMERVFRRGFKQISCGKSKLPKMA